VNLYFVTVSLTATSLIIGSVLKTSKPQPLNETLSCGLVGLTWAFALWIRHNDATVGLLSAFCRALELIDDPQNTIGIPAWHTEGQGWIVQARRYRNLSDGASILVSILALLPAIILAARAFVVARIGAGLILGAAGLVGLGAIVFLFLNARCRERIAASSFCKVDTYAFLPPTNTVRNSASQNGAGT
jgi:hypothetical protein